MAVFIEIIQGANLGQRYLLDEGLYLGRTQADIVVADSKVSSQHAYIRFDTEKSQYLLIDNNSSNGIIVNQQKVKKVPLLNGVVFQIGKTIFKVQHLYDFKVDVKDIQEYHKWPTVLKYLLPNVSIINPKELDIKMSFFTKPLTLSFIQGMQLGEKYIFSYGPRTLGSETMNNRIAEKTSPNEAFYLIPDQEHVYFKTLHPDIVLLNNQNVDEEILNEDDEIKIGNTIMKVSFK